MLSEGQTKGVEMLSSKSSFPGPFPPEKIWILGAGRFGFIAAQRLSRRLPQSDFLVIELREDRLAKIHRDLGLPIHVEDSLSFICKKPVADDIWIVPAIPVHVAFQWMLHELNKIGKASSLPVPEAVDPQVPNPYRMPNGTLYASFATFICPDSCNEPDDICTYTKQPRPGNLFEHLARIRLPDFNVAVIRSWQLAPGVGGYPAGYLREIFTQQVARQPGNHLIATSCRCHGVIDALHWSLTGQK